MNEDNPFQGRIALYGRASPLLFQHVGKECVRYHIPADAAVEALIDLLREHGKWVEPRNPRHLRKRLAML